LENTFYRLGGPHRQRRFFDDNFMAGIASFGDRARDPFAATRRLFSNTGF